jgi:hypothetical protein
MTGTQDHIKTKWVESQAFFIVFKLPALLATAVLGFIIEFVYEFPFMLVCLLESRFKK